MVARRAAPLTAPVDRELVMLDPEKGRYFGLDSVGHRIWELIETPKSVESLCGALQAEFDVSHETCRADVVAFLDQMQKAELVEIS